MKDLFEFIDECLREAAEEYLAEKGDDSRE
jgi:hypothetical protein